MTGPWTATRMRCASIAAHSAPSPWRGCGCATCLGEQLSFVRAVFFFGVAALILAFGKYGLAYVFLAELPVFRMFRCSCRYIVLVQLALTILASVALADMLKVLRQNVRIPWREQWPLLIPLGISVLTFSGASWFLLEPHPDHPYAAQLSSVFEAFIGLVIVLTAVGCCAATARGLVLGILGIILLTSVEIATGGIWLHLWKNGQPVTIEQLFDSTARPPTRDGRVLSFDQSNLLAAAGYHLMNGSLHDPVLRLFPKVLALSWAKDEHGSGKLVCSPQGVKALQLAGVKWILANGWVAVPSPLPRARLVAQVVVSDDEAAAFATIDPATTAIIDRAIGDTVGPPGTLHTTVDRPGWVEIDIDTPGRQVLVWAERYHSGWTAAVDGKPAPVLRAYGDFMACPVGPGRQHVVLRFQPASFTQGLRITIAGLCATLAFVGLLCIPIRRRRGVPSGSGFSVLIRVSPFLNRKQRYRSEYVK